MTGSMTKPPITEIILEIVAVQNNGNGELQRRKLLRLNLKLLGHRDMDISTDLPDK